MSDLTHNIKKHEGYVKNVYKDSLGIDTIGYGFAIKDLELDEDLAEEILIRKVEKLIKRVRSKFDWLDSVPHEVQGVLVEMAYQMGLSSVCRFRLALKYMENQNWERAADEMLLSKWNRQTPNRAKELSNIIRSL